MSSFDLDRYVKYNYAVMKECSPCICFYSIRKWVKCCRPSRVMAIFPAAIMN